MKSINIQGKEYIMVHERILEFHKRYPKGYIVTEILSPLDSDMVVMRATVEPNDTENDRPFIAHSQASWNDTKSKVNSTSALENCETSAVGRALGFLGVGIVEGFASADEVVKAQNTTPWDQRPASEKQVKLIEGLVSRKELPDQWLKAHNLEKFEDIKFRDVNKLLAELKE